VSGGWGSWRHKGNALIVVSYDGLSPPSVIVMNTIGLWVYFYDLLVALRKANYVQKLGARVGQVQAINMSFFELCQGSCYVPSGKCLGPGGEDPH
jgi:hypothetical protein